MKRRYMLGYLQSISQGIVYLLVILSLFLILRVILFAIDISSRDISYTPLYDKANKGKKIFHYRTSFLANGDCHLGGYKSSSKYKSRYGDGNYYCYSSDGKLLWKEIRMIFLINI